MARAPFQVLVIPYALDAFAEAAYALFRDRDDRRASWHGLVERGRRGETPLEAAARQAGVARDGAYLALDSRATLAAEPGEGGCGMAQYAFAVAVQDPTALRVRAEHECCWVSYEVARGLVRSDAERDALWELRRRLGHRAACG